MSEITLAIDKHTKIMAAVNWKPQSETVLGDVNYVAFCRVMEYRKQVAVRYLQEKDENAKMNIEAILNHCNDNIRQILGL